MTKTDLLRKISFGRRVAEEEVDSIANYFVETDQWRRIFSGDIDIVYGPKGSGKSALYTLLVNREGELFDQGKLVVSGENPRGQPAFSDLVVDPPASEEEFTGLWKAYLLSLLGSVLQEYAATSDAAREAQSMLADAGLLEPRSSLKNKLKAAYDYVRRWFHPDCIEAGMALDPATGAPTGFTGKITFAEPSAEGRMKGLRSAGSLFNLVDRALGELGFEVWVLLDRLDVAFPDSRALEENALRALFKVYIDLLGMKQIKLKVFLRSDIWRRITSVGFREASHITRDVTISWDPHSLLNLVVRRALQNECLCEVYSVAAEDVLASVDRQAEFFYRLFPEQVEVGSRKPKTLEWMLGRTRDSSGDNAPRELIHLLNASRERQVAKLEVGGAEPAEETLFDRAVLKDALAEVSKVRLEKTLLAEYPNLGEALRALDGQKTSQTPGTLARIWGIDEPEALATANRLVDVGFFESRGTRESPKYWVALLYRPALNMVQGSAEVD